MLKRYLILLLSCTIALSSCKKDEIIQKTLPSINDGDVDGSLKINQLQYLSSHNSYRKKTDEDILSFITNISNLLPAEFNPIELDYNHIPLEDQLTKYGVRHLELDLYLDPNGGKFYNRKGNAFAERDEASGIAELQEPGIKILHLADVDFNTHHYSFIDALKLLKNWSNNYPQHLPIFIQLELSEKGLASKLRICGTRIMG